MKIVFKNQSFDVWLSEDELVEELVSQPSIKSKLIVLCDILGLAKSNQTLKWCEYDKDIKESLKNNLKKLLKLLA